MTNKNKIRGLFLLLILSLTIFILQVFIFQKPDGNIGLLLCITCALGIIISIIKLYQLSSTFKKILQSLMDNLF